MEIKELAKIILSWMKTKYGEYSHFKMEDYWQQYDWGRAAPVAAGKGMG